MIVFQFSIESGNAAFAGVHAGWWDSAGADEVARLLRDCAGKVQGGQAHGALIDVNGNTAGRWSLKVRDDAGQELLGLEDGDTV